MLKKLLLAHLCVVFVTSAAYAAKPVSPMQVTKPIYVWKTDSETDPKTKAFDHCTVQNMYDNGTSVILAQNAQGAKRLALNFPQRKMQAGQHFDLAIQVDRKDVFPVEAVAVNAQILTIGIPEGLPDQMRRGQMLHIRGPNDEVIYDLQGMEGAVASLQDCMLAQNARMAVAQTDDAPVVAPVAKNAAPDKAEKPITKELPKVAEKPVDVKTAAATITPPVSVPAKTSEKTVPAPQEKKSFTDRFSSLKHEKIIEVASDPLLPPALHGVYAAAGLAPEKLIPIKAGKEQPLDYLWQKQSVFMGIKQKPIAANETIEKVSVDYLRMLRERCKGNFLAESTKIQTTPSKGMTWQATEAACSSTSKGDSIGAILFATTPKGAEIFFFESGADQGAGAIKARDAIQNIVTRD